MAFHFLPIKPMWWKQENLLKKSCPNLNLNSICQTIQPKALDSKPMREFTQTIQSTFDYQIHVFRKKINDLIEFSRISADLIDVESICFNSRHRLIACHIIIKSKLRKPCAFCWTKFVHINDERNADYVRSPIKSISSQLSTCADWSIKLLATRHFSNDLEKSEIFHHQFFSINTDCEFEFDQQSLEVTSFKKFSFYRNFSLFLWLQFRDFEFFSHFLQRNLLLFNRKAITLFDFKMFKSLIAVFLFVVLANGNEIRKLSDFIVKDLDGKDISFKRAEGNCVLISKFFRYFFLFLWLNSFRLKINLFHSLSKHWQRLRSNERKHEMVEQHQPALPGTHGDRIPLKQL